MGETNNQAAEPGLLQREAVAWVQRLVSGHATVADANALKRWCAQSRAHAAAFAEASHVWGDIEPAGRSWRNRNGAMPPVPARSTPSRRMLTRRAFLGGGLATAATAAAYTVVRPPLGLWPSLRELSADYRTATGEQRQVELANNVSVRMNTQTSITVHAFQTEVDRVELVAGEAFFVKQSRASRSLEVLAADGRMLTGGARFDVRHMSGEAGPSVCVTCFDGDIRIAQRREEVVLGSAQQVRYDQRGLGRVTTVDPELASAWRQGIVVFRSTPLAEVVEEINRYRPGRIILINAELGRMPVSGRFRIDQMAEILTRLEQAFGAHTQALPGGIVLMS